MRLFRPLSALLVPTLLLGSLAGRAVALGYEVGPGDVLTVTIRGGAEGDNADQLLTIAGDGSIDVEFAGRFTVTGSTTPEIQSAITDRLKEKRIFAFPRVSVNISEYGSQPVNVAGAVGNPMRVFLKGPATLRDILAEAGGITTEAAGLEIRIQRRGASAPIVVMRADLYGIDPAAIAEANLAMQAQDDVFVTSKGRACVNGPVKDPGCFDLDDGATVLTLLALAGGLDVEMASRETITIWRTYPKEDKLVIGMNRIETGMDRPPLIMPGDNILVGVLLKVTVGGSVKNPGVVGYYKGMTISDAIAEAGGVEAADIYGNLKNVTLRREGETRVINVKRIQSGKEPDIPLEPGDKIHVKPKRLGL